jgi:hypothetical protein
VLTQNCERASKEVLSAYTLESGILVTKTFVSEVLLEDVAPPEYTYINCYIDGISVSADEYKKEKMRYYDRAVYWMETDSGYYGQNEAHAFLEMLQGVART